MRDYRENQFRKDWWDEIVFLRLTRNDLMHVALGFVLAVLYIKFGLPADYVFGLRAK